jgi:hypothetical protein
MKSPIGLLAPLALSCACAFAQQSGTYATSDANTHTTTYQTPQGPLVVNSGQLDARQYGPPPAFAQLASGGTGYLTADEAGSYPPLANDFIHADRNRDGRISKAEYARWSSRPQ